MINFYVITCDKTSWILKSFANMANKLWKRDYTILGFSKHPELPENFSFVSMGDKQESIQTWTKDIYNIIKDDPNDYVLFGLDDYIMIEKFNDEIFSEVIDIMKMNNVSRYELSYGSSLKKKYKIVSRNPSYDIFEFDQETNYRVSCQVSVWRKDYLLRFLNNDWTPWEFEKIGSRQAMNDGAKIIGTLRGFASRHIEESMLSGRHPNNVNVLGLRPKYINELIDLGHITKGSIQYGMGRGEMPKTVVIDNIGDKYKKYYL